MIVSKPKTCFSALPIIPQPLSLYSLPLYEWGKWCGTANSYDADASTVIALLDTNKGSSISSMMESDLTKSCSKDWPYSGLEISETYRIRKGTDVP
jgi:hypothetical protein